MTDTIKNFTPEGSIGKSWKNRFQNKWPTMTTLMQQSEITIQPYIHEYTDPHEIMAYRTCKIPDWDGSSEASWSAARSTQHDMIEDSSATEITGTIKEKRCETTCRHLLCIFLILSIVMATAAAIGLSIFLKLHDHGLAEHRGHHHHGNHIHSNITTEQGIYLSKLFCSVVKRILRRDFPVERGLKGCHTALLFIENSEDVHIEMHVSPKKGYTIKEKILRSLRDWILTDQNSRLRVKEKRTTDIAATKEFPMSGPTTSGFKPTRSRAVYTNMPASVTGETSTTFYPPSTRQSTKDSMLQDISSKGIENFETSDRPFEGSNFVTTEESVFIATTSQDVVSSEYLSDFASPTTLPPIVVDSEPIPDIKTADKTTSLPPVSTEHELKLSDSTPFDKTSFSSNFPMYKPRKSDTDYLKETTSHPSPIAESERKRLDTFYLDKTTLLPPIFVESKPKHLNTIYLDKTTSNPSIFVEEISKKSDTIISDKSSFLPPIIENDPIQNSQDRNQTSTVITIEHDPTPTNTNSPPQLQAKVTKAGGITATFKQNDKQQWNEIPIATRLFNPELLDSTDVSGSIKENIKPQHSRSPKIVESLMSGGVMKLPFKTNSNFRFLFSSDSKVKNTNQNSLSKPRSVVVTNNEEIEPQRLSSHKANTNILENSSTKTNIDYGQKVSNLFTKKPKIPDLFRTIQLPVSSTKPIVQRKMVLPKKPKRRLDLTEFGEPSLVSR